MTENYYIFDSRFDTIKDKFSRLDVSNYSLIITGTIGSGKTTIVEFIKRYTKNITMVSEFLAFDNTTGNQLLEYKINHTISANCFQHYILDILDKTYEQQYDRSKFVILERIVDDSVDVFCDIDYRQGLLTTKEYETLKEKRDNINNKYSIPSYSTCDKIIIDTTDLLQNLERIYDIIMDDIEHGITTRVIGLKISKDLSKQRITQRNRSGENNYSDDFIRMYTEYYDKIFDQ